MPLIGTRGAASAQGFGEFAQSAAPNYIEDVFSTWLYTGTAAVQTITNGIDLSTKGGMVWMKNRTTAYNNAIVDSARGLTNGNILYTNLTNSAQTGYPENTAGISAFNTTGFTLRADADGVGTNYASGDKIASWTFRKQPKFFDVVTGTTDASGNLTVSHNLGSVPGFVIVKRTDGSGVWYCYHTSLGNNKYIALNTTAASVNFGGAFSASSTSFSWNMGSVANSATVVYLFAHNAGGFGLTGTDNVISCGAFTTDGSGNAAVNLGYEPQWILIKQTSDAFGGVTGNWSIQDSMRGLGAPFLAAPWLYANTSDAEVQNYFRASITATGFNGANYDADTPFIYIAIRRGPMKVPTDATKVFSPVTRTGTNAAATVAAGFTPDLYNGFQTSGGSKFFLDRLRGRDVSLRSNSDAGETTSSNATFDLVSFDMNGVTLGPNGNISINTNAIPYVNYFYKRAPQFFDEVCYSGTGTAMTVAHNLAAVPEFIIVKRRSGTETWPCYTATTGPTNRLQLNLDSGSQLRASAWNNTAPTSSVFTVGTEPNVSGQRYVAYLFATCPGVSKVGSYTGNGTTQAIACGFTGGARFVLIKRTDASGDWYVYDTARGMTVLTDPYLLLNTTDAETATLGSVTTTTGGFTVNASILAAINTNAATYIFLAIA